MSSNTKLYQNILDEFRKENFAKTIELCNQAINDIHQDADSIKEIKELKAFSLQELKLAEQASLLYEELKLYTQAGFAAILTKDFNRAQKLYSQAEFSPARKWGEFLIDFLHSNKIEIASPGYLTFRLYFESSFGYFLSHELKEYIQRFLNNRSSLEKIYPDITKDIGSAHLAREEYGRALELLKEAETKSMFEDAGILFKSAIAFLALNHKDKARDFLLKLQKTMPGSTLIEDLLKGLKS